MISKSYIMFLLIISIIYLFIENNAYGQNDFKVSPFKLKKQSPSNKRTDPLKNSQIKSTDDITINKKINLFIGLKGGLQWSNGESSSISNLESKLDYPYGFTIDYQFIPYLSIGLYLHYTNKGATSIDNTGANTITMNFEYIGIIPDIKIYPFKRFLYISFGPSLYINTGDSLSIAVFGVQNGFSNKFVWGLNAGIGLFYDFADIRILLEGRYDYGMSEMIDQNILPQGQAKFRDLQLLLGISYHL